MDSRYHGFFAIHAIAIITFAQLFGTSLWFSANSTVLDLIREWHISIAGQVLAKLLRLGTSFLYALNSLSVDLSRHFMIIFSSSLALTAVFLIFKLGDKQQSLAPKIPENQKPKESAYEVFKNPPFRAAAFGYFSHMWELYAFWTIIFLSFGITTYMFDGC